MSILIFDRNPELLVNLKKLYLLHGNSSIPTTFIKGDIFDQLSLVGNNFICVYNVHKNGSIYQEFQFTEDFINYIMEVE